MKYFAVAALMALTACASTGGSWRNTHYSHMCGYAVDQAGICNGEY